MSKILNFLDWTDLIFDKIFAIYWRWLKNLQNLQNLELFLEEDIFITKFNFGFWETIKNFFCTHITQVPVSDMWITWWFCKFSCVWASTQTRERNKIFHRKLSPGVCKNSFIISIWLDSLKVIYRKIIRPQRYGISVVHVWSQKSNFTRSNMTQMVVDKFNCCSCKPSLKRTLITFRLGTVSPIRVWITIGCNRCRCRRRNYCKSL